MWLYVGTPSKKYRARSGKGTSRRDGFFTLPLKKCMKPSHEKLSRNFLNDKELQKIWFGTSKPYLLLGETIGVARQKVRFCIMKPPVVDICKEKFFSLGVPSCVQTGLVRAYCTTLKRMRNSCFSSFQLVPNSSKRPICDVERTCLPMHGHTS